MNNIEQRWSHTVVWQISPGGSSAFGISMVSMCTGISLYFLISWPFRMGSHWWHWTAKIFTQCSGSFRWGVYCQFYLGKSENFELTCHFMLCFTEGLYILHMKDLINNKCMTDLSSSSTPNDNAKSWIPHNAVYDVKLLWLFQTLWWGVHLPLVYLCAIDLVVKLILCSSMAGISAWLTGGASAFGIYMCNRSSSKSYMV